MWIFSFLMKDQTFEFITKMCYMKRNTQNQMLLVNNYWERNIILKIQINKSTYEHSNTMKYSPKTWVKSDLPSWILSTLTVLKTLVPIKRTTRMSWWKLMEFVTLIWKVVSLPLWIWNDLEGNLWTGFNNPQLA